GNTHTLPVNVTVLDTMRPIARANNLTLYLNANGQATTSTTAINNGSTDNVGIVQLALSKSSFDCTNLGIQTIHLLVTDSSGNVGVANASITVLSTMKPVANVLSYITLYLNNNGYASFAVSDIDNGTSDNCSITTKTLSKIQFNC